MPESKLPRIGISIGDVNGVGPEVVLKTFQDPRMFELCTPVVFASQKLLAFVKKSLEIEVEVRGVRPGQGLQPNCLNALPPDGNEPMVQFGELHDEAGAYAVRSLEQAVNSLKKGEIDALITAPVNKSNIQSENFAFPGHTDYLAREFQGESLMFMVGNTLRVGLMTDHLPVREVSDAIDSELVRRKLGLMEHSLRQDFGIVRPRIAVLGINPHSGDHGTIGQEDETILKPVLQELRDKKMLVYGPYGADGFFGSGAYKEFDGILAAYHDQGLIPFKTVTFGKGVNFTAGLSIVRTSPDHGTALDIAGKGEADEGSFREAVYTAMHVLRNRKLYAEVNANPLKKQRPERR